jgi:hypothetical protein
MIMLGDLVRDKVTAFEGVVTGYTKHMYNCDRAYVQPRGLKDGKIVDGVWQDVPRLELTEAAVVLGTATREKPFNYGDEVVDTVTDYKGKVVGHSYYLSGCLHVGIQGKTINKDGLPAETWWVPVQGVKLVKAAKPAKKTSAAKGPGGPMSAPTRSGDPRRI